MRAICAAGRYTKKRSKQSAKTGKFVYIQDWDDVLDKSFQESRQDPRVVDELQSKMRMNQHVVWKDDSRLVSATKFKMWQGVQDSKRTAVQKAKKRKWQEEHNYVEPKRFDFELLKVNYWDCTIPELLERGQAGRLKMQTLHVAGLVSTAVHSSSLKALRHIHALGFDTQAVHGKA